MRSMQVTISLKTATYETENKCISFREANFSGLRFIAINDNFGPIYCDKFDKIR